ncbi:SigE family RNA polymerase sigma factor [Nocardioides perillae]|uniref:RNA polymerase sigma-70 factor (Sigma-E family) n=1 Tax=Nocardioides perillae TaxID=1119534 RepID=A0A7Y9RR65_9ACTN|nr:RNA polymerase sigma-70 factor (sigma-E family) [Nocardioides perillae]
MGRGVDEEFEQWVRARSGGLARTALLLTGDVHRAEDLVQETLARVAQHWPRLVRRGEPDAYARRVLHHAAVDGWRRRRVRPQEAPPVTGEEPTALTAYDGGAAADRRLLLREALDRLTPKQRAVLVLRYYDDLTEVQTAEVLRCSVSTVKSQARVALARLRQLAPDLLAELGDLPDPAAAGRPEVVSP